MNSQEQMNAVRQILTALFSMLTILVPSFANSDGYSAITAGVLAAIPAFFTLASISWSIYAHWGQKKVPNAAVAIEPVGEPLLDSNQLKPGTVLDLAPLTGTVKVVG